MTRHTSILFKSHSVDSIEECVSMAGEHRPVQADTARIPGEAAAGLQCPYPRPKWEMPISNVMSPGQAPAEVGDAGAEPDVAEESPGHRR